MTTTKPKPPAPEPPAGPALQQLGELGTVDRLVSVFARDWGPPPPAAGPVRHISRRQVARAILESVDDSQRTILRRHFGEVSIVTPAELALYDGLGEGVFFWIDRLLLRPGSPFADLDHCRLEFRRHVKRGCVPFGTDGLFDTIASVPGLMLRHRLTFGTPGGGWT